MITILLEKMELNTLLEINHQTRREMIIQDQEHMKVLLDLLKTEQLLTRLEVDNREQMLSLKAK